jgi:hypothetical protein
VTLGWEKWDGGYVIAFMEKTTKKFYYINIVAKCLKAGTGE